MMMLLIAGVLLWSAAHLFKRATPGVRAGLQARMGDASKGVMAVLLLVSVVMMVIGFRGSEFIHVYDPPAWGLHLNNLLMVISVILFGAANSKSRIRRWLRHPMLTGMAIWGVAHLIANGDQASLILFGGMVVWAMVEIALINARAPEWQAPDNVSASGDIKLLVISAVVFAVIAFIHNWLGYWPFGG